MPAFKEHKKGGSREQQAGQPHPISWECGGEIDPEKHFRQIKEEEMIRGRAWLHQEVVLDQLDEGL